MASQQLETIVQEMRSIHWAELSIEEQRAALDAMVTEFQLPDDVRAERVNASGVPAEWINTPGGVEGRVIYYLHGGGYNIGAVNTHRELISRLSRTAGARVLAIDYRLAPEHPFPAAVEDAMAAYRWLLSTGVDPRGIVIAGDSAGGGLTMATLVSLRDEGEPLPAAAVCLSPWVDLEELGESIVRNAECDILRREDLLKWAEAYLREAYPRTPLAAPLYADLTELPPLLIQVGTAEVLLDDSTRLADRARSAGVEVVLEPWDDMTHVWQFWAAVLPEGQQAIDRIGAFVQRHTGRG